MIKLGRTVTEVLESDVIRIAKEPERWGLDGWETIAYQLVERHYDRGFFRIPTDIQEQNMVYDLVSDLSRLYEERGEGNIPSDAREKDDRRRGRWLRAFAERIVEEER